MFSGDDLALIRPLGERLVITHYDLIAYHNPMYFPSAPVWQRFVRSTREALAAADHVLFFSNHALVDALREDLVERARCSVAHPGIDSDTATDDVPPAETPVPPSSAPALRDTPFLLCIGADYLHKNRPFALALLDELRRRKNWPGVLVLAGPHVEHGSSAAQEQAVRTQRRISPANVIQLEAVSDSERSWLMRSAAAVVYPTVHEGFGLVPFEAAASSVPCLFAAQSSLKELLDADLAALIPWDPARSADRALALLSDGPQRREHVRQLSAAAAALRWDECARDTVGAYRQAIAAPYRASTEGAWQALEREREVVRLDGHIDDLTGRVLHMTEELEAIGPDGLALVGPERLLSEDDQHTLLAVAARPALRRLLLGTMRSGFRATRAARRLAGRGAAVDADSDR